MNECIPELLVALEQFRSLAEARWSATRWGADQKPFPGVLIHDAYRCLIHNAQVTGAASDSQHTNGRAADLSIEGMTAAELEAIALEIPAFRGIGRDDDGQYIHVDIRPTLRLARWCYYRDAAGRTSWGKWYAAGGAPVSA